MSSKSPCRGVITIWYKVKLPWYDPEGSEPSESEMENMGEAYPPGLVDAQFRATPHEPLAHNFQEAAAAETTPHSLHAWTVREADEDHEKRAPAPCAITGDFDFAVEARRIATGYQDSSDEE